LRENGSGIGAEGFNVAVIEHGHGAGHSTRASVAAE
jgi:hypothetical protein